MHRLLLCLSVLSILGGCISTSPPSTVGEQGSGYTYVPIDPFSVDTVPGDGCKDTAQQKAKTYGTLLESLPDNAVRMLIEQFNASGSVTYGPVKLGSKGEAYRITIDYINADTINVPFWISKYGVAANGDLVTLPPIGGAPPGTTKVIPGSEYFTASRDKPEKVWASYDVEFNIPVYIGIGLRVSATVDVIGSNANISGIGVIGAEAEADRLRGSLIVQTLGVNGKSIAAALPIQSELNRTTAQNAIVAVGSIKALLYANDTAVAPRVVGLYLPFPGGKPLVNSLISELSKKRVQWERPCLVDPDTTLARAKQTPATSALATTPSTTEATAVSNPASVGATPITTRPDKVGPVASPPTSARATAVAPVVNNPASSQTPGLTTPGKVAPSTSAQAAAPSTTGRAREGNPARPNAAPTITTPGKVAPATVAPTPGT